MFMLPGFKDLACLYRGGKSEIYRAVLRDNDQPYIIKIPAKKAGPEVVKTIRREFELLSRISHPHIIKVEGLEETERGPALILENFPGTTLAQRISESRIPPETFFEIAPLICAALQAVHDAHIVHKDLNPFNILVNDDFSDLRLIDLGHAQPFDAPRHSSTIAGTPAYTAPEQTGRTKHHLDYRADYYALGVTFYEMLSGNSPFEADDPLATLHGHIAKKAVPLSEINAGIPEPLSKIIQKLIHKEPNQRYRRLSAVLDDIDQCREFWILDGGEDFEPGRSDDKAGQDQEHPFFARDEELAALTDLFEEVERGATRVVLLEGEPGVGKSSLAQAFEERTQQHGARFIQGKFDQLNRDIPFDGFIQAMRGLIHQLLTETPENLALWGKRLNRSLQGTGGLVLSFFPELEIILGRQEQPAKLPPTEAANRFNNTFHKLIQCFTQDGRPLIIFLDDIQWADSGSIRLIEGLRKDPLSRQILLLTAARSTSASGQESNGDLYDQIQIDRCLSLSPFSMVEIAQYLESRYNMKEEDSRRAAAICRQKTGGNPFYLETFLKLVRHEKLLQFDNQLGKWAIDIDAVSAMKTTENVADLLIQRLAELEPNHRRVLSAGACIGTTFRASLLAEALELEAVETRRALKPALREQYLLSLDSKLEQFRFSHDRIQLAAYQSTTPEERADIHQRLGEILIKSGRENDLFPAVGHLNRGKTPSQVASRIRLANLNLKAGKAAKRNTAYDPADHFFQQGLNLLDAIPSQEEKKLRFNLTLQCAESAFLVGKPDAADHYFDLAFAQAENLEQKLFTLIKREHFETYRGRPAQAFEYGKTALTLLNRPFPEGEDALSLQVDQLEKEVRTQLDHFSQSWTRDRDAAKKRDPVFEILASLVPSSYYISPRHFAVSGLLLIKHGLEVGKVDGLAFALANYAMLLVSRGDYGPAKELADMALLELDTETNPIIRVRVGFLIGAFIGPWILPHKKTHEFLSQTVVAAQNCGDYLFQRYAVTHQILQSIYNGRPIKETLSFIETDLSHAERTGAEDTLGLHSVTQSWCLFLREPDSDSPTMDERLEALGFGAQQLASRGPKYNLATYHNLRFQFFIHREDFQAAAQEYDAFLNYEWAFAGTIHNHAPRVLHPLLLAELGNETAADNLRATIAYLASLAEGQASGFAFRADLLKAELARIEAQPWQAHTYFEAALKGAVKDKNFLWAGLIATRHARFWLAQGQVDFAESLLLKSSRLYQNYGADRLVVELSRRYPHFFPKKRSFSGKEAFQTTSYSDENGDRLDTITVIKSTRAMSSEILLPRLLRRLMDLAMENAGADKGILVLKDHDNEALLVEMVETVDSPKAGALLGIPLTSHKGVPQTVIHYVKRTQKALVLDDAGQSMFVRDPYMQRFKPKSILCIPLRHHENTLGWLYLENSMVPGAFSEERRETLKLLADQAAISIENARLYGRLENYSRTLESKVRQRTQALEQRNSELEKMDEIVRAVNREIHLDRVLQSILVHGISLFEDADKAIFLLRGSTSDRYRISAHIGFKRPPATDQTWSPRGLRKGFAAFTRLLETDIYLTHPPETSVDGFPNLGPNPYLVLAIRRKSRTMGYLILIHSKKNGSFDHGDITRLSRLRRHLVSAFEKAEYLRALQQKNEEILRTRDQLVMQEKMASLGTLTAGVAHEINNPTHFAGVSAQNLHHDLDRFRNLMLEMAADEGDAEITTMLAEQFDRLQNHVEVIQEGTRRIQNIVRDLRTFSRLDEAALKQTDLCECLESTLNLVNANYSDQVQLEKNFQDRPQIWCRPAEMNQVFMNIIVNACQAVIGRFGAASAGQGRITVTTRTDQDEALIIIEDNGTGIPDSIRDKIFEPFFTTKPVGKGTGLGLSISFGIIRKHKGNIELETKIGQGSRFILRLPSGEPDPDDTGKDR